MTAVAGTASVTTIVTVEVTDPPPLLSYTKAAYVFASDGTFLHAGGDFWRSGFVPMHHLTALNPNGAANSNFDPGAGFDQPTTAAVSITCGAPLYTSPISSPSVQAIIAVANGAYLVGGNFTTGSGGALAGLARLIGNSGSFGCGLRLDVQATKNMRVNGEVDSLLNVGGIA